ncbi:cilia- and flagella-associated protein 100-like [Rhopilema esculentum]|uniref:cilia- and flagella-associated protein 100-like n=1 Tax=Rhopilema esculentum TaxID=499914 RepID=UPI0031DB09D7|eukprot:gene1439-15865_t
MSRPSTISKVQSVATKSLSPIGTSVSRQSGQVTFPRSEKSLSKHSALSLLNGDSEPFVKKDVNPFKMPADHDILMLRDKEKQKKKKERETQRELKVHQKTTYTSRVNARTKSMIKPAADIEDDVSIDEEKEKDGVWTVKEDPQFVLTTTRDRNIEKENLAEFISKKREMFLVQYSLGVKRDEMRKLEEIAQAEEKKLEMAEQYLEEDAAMFDEFLKENDKLAVDAIKNAEVETKAKLEKVAEIKRINAQMMSIKSEISKNEDTLKEYMLYKKFLDALAPQEWKEERKRQKTAKMKERDRISKEREKSQSSIGRGRRTSVGSSSLHEKPSRGTARRKESRSKASMSSGRRKSSHHDSEDSRSVISVDMVSDDEDSDDDVELFFRDPLQLLDIFTELEEQNLSLIQNSQETEEALEDMRKTIQQTQDKMNKETDALKQQIRQLKQATKDEQEKAAELKMKSKMFSYGEFKAEDQEKMLAELDRKVGDVYRNCIGDNEANISTLQMLTNIENRLEELFEIIEMLPQDKVELAEKAKEKERRLRLREEKLEAQKRHQEERLRRALERAQAEPKKKQGRKLNFRSAPPQAKKREDTTNEKQDKEEEEMKYFFT